MGNKFGKVNGGLESQNKSWGGKKIEDLQCFFHCADALGTHSNSVDSGGPLTVKKGI